MCWPQANDRLPPPGSAPRSPPLSNGNKALWIMWVKQWRWRTRLVRLPQICFLCFPRGRRCRTHLLIVTYSADQIMYGFIVLLLSRLDHAASILDTKPPCLFWISLSPLITAVACTVERAPLVFLVCITWHREDVAYWKEMLHHFIYGAVTCRPTGVTKKKEKAPHVNPWCFQSLANNKLMGSICILNDKL